MRGTGWAGADIDTSVAHPARMYDYFLGGKDNYPVDRIAAERVLEAAPEMRLIARENRRFLQRVVRFLVGGAGIRQILDIGTGLPAAGNVHEVAREIAPDTRVVYADNDPIVLAHANALLAGSGPTRVLLADLRNPQEILEDLSAQSFIDFDQPVGLLLVDILHFIRDEEDPAGAVKALVDALPAGSYLALSHAMADLRPDVANQVAAEYANATSSLTVRSHAQISTFFDRCDLVHPGLVQVPVWRPEGNPPKGHDQVWLYGGVGRRT